MRIFLPIQLKQTGGSSSFAKKLKGGLEPKGHEVFFEYRRDYDLLLVNAICPPRYLIEAKIRRKPIVQRLDGVYYPGTIAGRKYRLYNLPMQIINLFFSDYVIYQSLYSKESCDRYLGSNRYIDYSIIYNGVDTDFFTHRGEEIYIRDNDNQHLFVTASRFRRQDQIDPIIKAFSVYRDRYEKNAKLAVIGNFEGEVKELPRKYGNDHSINFTGALDNEKLPLYLRLADVFLFTHLNPPCPNNVLEAMACGLPICGVNDGAMPEIVTPGKNGELVEPKWNNNGSRVIDSSLFAANMKKIMNRRRQYAKNSRVMAVSSFKLNRMTDEYLSVFEYLLRYNDK